MKIENNKMVYELEECISCSGSGLYPSHKTCPKCKGTCRGPKGGKNGCKNCYSGTIIDYENKVSCGGCSGTGKKMETRYSHISEQMFKSIPLEVHQGPITRQTFSEAYLGLGSIASVTDYGKTSKMSDAELISMIVNEKHLAGQALGICDKQDNVCKAVVIFKNDNGYSLRARF